MFDIEKVVKLADTALDSIDEETREKCKKLVQKYVLTHTDEYVEKAQELLAKYADTPAVKELLDFLKK